MKARSAVVLPNTTSGVYVGVTARLPKVSVLSDENSWTLMAVCGGDVVHRIWSGQRADGRFSANEECRLRDERRCQITDQLD
jgi:hypothetical protein